MILEYLYIVNIPHHICLEIHYNQNFSFISSSVGYTTILGLFSKNNFAYCHSFFLDNIISEYKIAGVEFVPPQCAHHFIQSCVRFPVFFLCLIYMFTEISVPDFDNLLKILTISLQI